MKQNRFLYLLLCLTAMFTVSCKDTEILMPSVSGAAFEVLLVIDDEVYETPAGETMFNILSEDVPKMPQSEPQFDVSRIEYSNFSELFRTTRSIVFVVVDSAKYTKTTINLINSRWAKTQTVVNVTAANIDDLKVALEANGDRIVDYLIEGERSRQMAYINKNASQKVLEYTTRMFGCKIAIPSTMSRFKEGENFLWISNKNQMSQQSVVIYTVPYTSVDQLTRESLLSIRDSVMAVNIPGSMPDSHMGTEYKYDPPTMTTFNFRNSWSAEIRGLWRMVDGAMMGGPFVSHVHIDEMNSRIIVVEGFVFAPAKNKRNTVRQLEAMLYSIVLPHEVNAVIVTN